MIERRKWQRYNLDLPIRVEGTDQSGAAFAYAGRLRNISARGALATIRRYLQVGTRISLAVAFPLSRLIWMRYDCEVIRTEAAGAGVDTALMFTSVRPSFSGWDQDDED